MPSSVSFKKDLYKIALDEDENLDKRWEALRNIRNHKIHNMLNMRN